MKEEQTYLELHKALALLLRKNRFIRKLTHTGLNRAEVHVLIEMQSREEANIKTMQSILNVDQSQVSRLIKNLVNKKLLKSTTSTEDARAKNLKLTPKGVEMVEQIDLVAGGVYESFVSRLNATEGKVLLKFFKDIADWYKQPECPRREKENEIRLQQRRMSRALGVLSQNLFNSALSPTQWHVFTEICQAGYPLNPKQISENNNVAANTLSLIIDKLAGLGYVEKKVATHDSRYIELYSTPAGQAFLNQIEEASANNLKEILAGQNKKSVNQLLEILLRYVDHKPTVEVVQLPSEYLFKEVKSKPSRQTLRKFAIEELVGRGHSEFAPAIIIAEKDSHIYVLTDLNQELMAICEVFEIKNTDNFSLLASTKKVSPSTAFAFIEEVLRARSQNNTKSKKTIFSFQPAARLLQKAGRLSGNSLN